MNLRSNLFIIIMLSSAFVFAQGQSNYVDSVSITKNGAAKYYTPLGSKDFFNKKQICKEQLWVQVGINCYSMSEDNFNPCHVKSYCILLISKEKVLYHGYQNDALFTAELKQEFKKLTSGDLVVVYNIRIANSKGEEKAPSFVYDIL